MKCDYCNDCKECDKIKGIAKAVKKEVRAKDTEVYKTLTAEKEWIDKLAGDLL